MNSNLFERKSFLDGTWITANLSDYFSTHISGRNIIMTVNLLRATANESDELKKYLLSFPVKEVDSIIIDLSQCTFVDSTFLSSIISYNKMTAVPIKLVVSNRRQLTIFKITKLDCIFNIYSSLEQAL